ncbi:NapH/MauN family ferredoxin-type protein [Campylobacter curvus]|uniref:NapH/MauN family ferredoxin-type protein n=1 Tax=Campylobacter curvus TaxID=200 RepID=UPI0014703664|nr:NapH/MauN family ferredoxin-type protein [Campylobacter curvus]
MNKYTTRATVRQIGFFDTLISTDKNGKKRPSIRAWRIGVIVLVHLLFVLSYRADIQILEGDISGSRIFGFHLTDVFMSAQVFLSTHEMHVNLIIGSLSILAFYVIVGGRAFCSWICPYSLIGEIGEKWHENLRAKKLIKERNFDTKWRYVFTLFFLALSLASAQLVFEIFNVVGIFSRFIIYGYAHAIWFVVAVLSVEIFFSRRAWCRYVCPIGATYSLLARPNAMKVSWDKNRCDHCLVCIDVCLVPHVLEMTKTKAKDSSEQKETFRIAGADCTLCGRCIDVCHQDALKFDNGFKKLI